jgi:hypothetical protein
VDDKELIELAAKAAGIGIRGWFKHESCDGNVWYSIVTTTDHSPKGSFGTMHVWNPLTDDGDALRLAVKLGLTVVHYREPDHNDGVSVAYAPSFGKPVLASENGFDAATRRAIVRAAAALADNQGGV